MPRDEAHGWTEEWWQDDWVYLPPWGLQRPEADRVAGLDYFWDFYTDALTYLRKHGHRRAARPIKLAFNYADPACWTREKRIQAIMDLDRPDVIDYEVSPLLDLLIGSGWESNSWRLSTYSPTKTTIVYVPHWRAQQLSDASLLGCFTINLDYFVELKEIYGYLRVS